MARGILPCQTRPDVYNGAATRVAEIWHHRHVCRVGTSFNGAAISIAETALARMTVRRSWTRSLPARNTSQPSPPPLGSSWRVFPDLYTFTDMRRNANTLTTTDIAQVFSRAMLVLEIMDYLSIGGERRTDPGRPAARIWKNRPINAGLCLERGAMPRNASGRGPVSEKGAAAVRVHVVCTAGNLRKATSLLQEHLRIGRRRIECSLAPASRSACRRTRSALRPRQEIVLLPPSGPAAWNTATFP